MAINKPNEVYWEEKVGFSEKAWVLLSIVACIVMFMVMVAWAIAGKQNPPNEAYRVSIPSFAERAEAFIEKYKVDEENGIPVVEAPEDEDSYLIARMFYFSPVLILKQNQTYRIRVSSLDVQHGLSIQPVNMNFQVVPGYEYVLTIKPTEKGEFLIVCNEYCGLAHHVMKGKIIVK
ncbi:cytochrome c oxidase subunit 2 [Candidatus Kryptonium thompsonii]|uniref:Cytochrome c oxidase subunit 2 n=1 Tax=Candidatus Kryptonium thompsonii TaxID=1633631 RepID=A0A0P1LWM2_9BACT|nr:cytochrome C oxidase subunit II [Candidatus Kryptonium thompsoni]CUS78529.1 cytochrome c oxidase subunit 2 [Candidatus Kryptonium thompsoni]CUS82433.1 cytochrome c oxidase subunit 2 [Candidatus Kryptonium thompsoni]CUS82772.1 cytochrome c oxidase subunit 2 [Candidatus Kryptonium thompsoni]CUS85677.1 cytochrome c oxidase subunit 2 [Candidatus Kryptonium thompsoni]CUS86446.1 cytochrome c oxidase subunit 2 [Candidatus Kryptonium thompsoni]